jgi:hypothetical protein
MLCDGGADAVKASLKAGDELVLHMDGEGAIVGEDDAKVFILPRKTQG